MNKLYRFNVSCGRMGSLEGLFVADEVDVAAAIGKRMYFGEVLGKHSDIAFDLEAEHLTVASDDQDFLEKLVDLLGADISGFNPLDYVPGGSCNEDAEDAA